MFQKYNDTPAAICLGIYFRDKDEKDFIYFIDFMFWS